MEADGSVQLKAFLKPGIAAAIAAAAKAQDGAERVGGGRIPPFTAGCGAGGCCQGGEGAGRKQGERGGKLNCAEVTSLHSFMADKSGWLLPARAEREGKNAFVHSHACAAPTPAGPLPLSCCLPSNPLPPPAADWKAVGPPHKQRYMQFTGQPAAAVPGTDEAAAAAAQGGAAAPSAGALLAAVKAEVLQSAAFARLLRAMLGVEILKHAGEVRRFRAGEGLLCVDGRQPRCILGLPTHDP